MLKNIHIKNYHCIKDLKIDDFKRINLFVGENGVGKTTILKYISENETDLRVISGSLKEMTLEKENWLFSEEGKAKIYLIDEIENGLHYSIQKSMWEKLFAICIKNNSQIFATTHSIDIIGALNEAYKEKKNLLGEDEIRLFRVRKDQPKTVSYNASDIEIVVEERMDPR